VHRIGQKNSVNIYYLHGRDTMDDMLFELLQDKSLVTTGITDGSRKTLNLTKTDMKQIDMGSMAAKDGTMVQEANSSAEGSGGSPAPEQSRLERFFNTSRNETFVKRPVKLTVATVVAEEIESEEEELAGAV
jgi:hypothetical protein